jgi:hypothetical protein
MGKGLFSQKMFREFLNRIGTFLILMGIGLLILFIASDGTGAPNFDYLFWAMLSVIVGFFMRRRRESPQDADRFAMLRKLRGPGRDRKERK